MSTPAHQAILTAAREVHPKLERETEEVPTYIEFVKAVYDRLDRQVAVETIGDALDGTTEFEIRHH